MFTNVVSPTLSSLAAAVLMVLAGMQKRLLVRRGSTCVSCGRRAGTCTCR
jgi:hypothetical protein